MGLGVAKNPDLLKEYQDAVDVLLETLAELKRQEAAVKQANDEYWAKQDAYRDRQTVFQEAMRKDISLTIQRVMDGFEGELSRASGVYAVTDRARARFMEANKGRIKRAVNEATRGFREDQLRMVGSPPSEPDLSSVYDLIGRLKEEVTGLRELAADSLFELMGDVFTPRRELLTVANPNVVSFYRGTNLTRFVMNPESVAGGQREVRVLDFAPGIYEGVQCFSEEGGFGTGLSFALEPWFSHGMATLQDRHPYAVVMGLTIHRQAIPEFLRIGAMKRTGRSDEMLFDTDFLVKHAKFRLFDPYEV